MPFNVVCATSMHVMARAAWSYSFARPSPRSSLHQGRHRFEARRNGVVLRAAVESNLASIATAVAAAFSLHAWCNTIHEQFGPNGTVTPELMLR